MKDALRLIFNERVLPEFDFEEVARVFAFMQWEYDRVDVYRPSVWERILGSTSKGGIPDVEDLKRVANELFEKALESLDADGGQVRVRSGRLAVTLSAHKVALEFIPTSADTHMEDGYWV